MGSINLTKNAPSINLTKSNGGRGLMRVNLNWVQGSGRGADLDLGCLWETTDGAKGSVQALGNLFGSLDRAPYVLLDADDRTGASEGGENLTINLDHVGEIKRLLVFAYVYEGSFDWSAAQAVVTLHPVDATPIEIKLDDSSGSARSCAIALMSSNGSSMRIEREVAYIQGTQEQIDARYGWGMNWGTATK